MASGKIYGTTSNKYVDSKIEWSSMPNLATNTSIVTATLYYKRNNRSHRTLGTGTFTLTIDGESHTVSTWINPQDSWYFAISMTKTVSHNSDGTKTITISANGAVPPSSEIVGSGFESTSCEGTVTLDTIPKVTPIIKAWDVGDADPFKITWQPSYENLYYKLSFVLGSWSETSYTIHPNTTDEYTCEYRRNRGNDDFERNFQPNNRRESVIAELHTYLGDPDNGGTLVGTSSKTFQVTAESGRFSPEVDVTSSVVTPFKNFANSCLIGISKIKIEFKDFEAKYGASITGWGMTVAGKTYTRKNTQEGLDVVEITSDIIHNVSPGTFYLRYSVTDSRECTNTNALVLIAKPYEAPYISPKEGESKIICERCTETGEASEQGTYLHVKGTRNYSIITSGDFTNSCSVKCKYKPDGDEQFQEITLLSSEETSTDDFDVILDLKLDPKKVYNVELEIVDGTEIPKVVEFDIPSEYVDVEFREGGKGVALGKHATEEDLFDCEWNAKFHKNVFIKGEMISDFVIEQNKHNEWYYKKWDSGHAELWGIITLDKVEDSGRILSSTKGIPFQFIEYPTVTMTVSQADSQPYRQGAIVLSEAYKLGETQIKLMMIRDGGGLAEGNTAQISVVIKGKYKEISTGG